MWDKPFERAIQTTSRNLAVIGFIFVLLGIWSLRSAFSEQHAATAPPITRDGDALARLTKVPSNDRLTHVHADDDPLLVATEMKRDEDTHKETEGDKSLLVVPVNHHLLLVQVPIGKSRRDFTGLMTRIPDEAHDTVNQIPAGAKTALVPLMLDTTEDQSFNAGACFALAALFIGSGVIMLALGTSRLSVPSRHPAMKQLARFGNVMAVAGEVEDDMRRGSDRVGGLTVGTDWVFTQTPFKLQIMRMQEVVWIYPMVRTHTAYLLIPIARLHYLWMCDRNGRRMVTKVPGKQRDAGMETLARRMPWAIAGYTAELERTWKKNRAELVRQVDERMRERESRV